MAYAAPQSESKPKRRRYARHIRKFPLSFTPRPLVAKKCLYDLALDLFAPWGMRDYPGRQRVWMAISGTMPFVLHDARMGKRAYDLATIERLLSAVEIHHANLCAALEAVKAESARLKALPTKRHGFCKVDPVTGHDKRYRGRKNSPHNK